MFPGVDESTVPWMVQSDVPAIALGVAGALVDGINTFVGEEAEAEAELILTRFKNGVLLAMSRRSPRSEEAQQRLAAWTSTWQERTFSFCASMEASTALAMANIALNTTMRIRRDLDGTPPDPAAMRMMDPCGGTGSLPAAALQLGLGSVWASDVRPDFVLRGRQNLTQLGYRFRNPQTLSPVEGESLGVNQIRALSIQRAEARRAHRFEESDGVLKILQEAGLWVNDKTHHWAHADGRCGELPHKQMDAAVEDPSVDPQLENAPHAFFYHDANAEWPGWVAPAIQRGEVDMVICNTPWGNKIGNEGDGAEIVESLGRQFGCSRSEALVITLLVGKPCFADLARQDPASQAWELHPGREGLAAWSLLYHAEVGTSRKGCVLMLLVKKSFAERGPGKDYQRHHITSYDCASHGPGEGAATP